LATVHRVKGKFIFKREFSKLEKINIESMNAEDNFCYYPFIQVLLQPTGDISPCCYNQDYSLGRIQDKTLEEIWNDEPMKRLRRDFLDGKSHICKQQIKEIGCHRFSADRIKSFKNIELSEVQSTGLRRLDLRLNGMCNLECIMCNVWEQPNGVYDRFSFWEKGPTEIFPNLIEVDVLGGEPFIQPDTFRLIKEVTSVNANCSWTFATNGHYRFSDKIKEALDKIKIRWINISVDSLNPETYKNIRVNGDISKPLDTLEHLIEYQKRRLAEDRFFEIGVTMCVQKKNWREIGSFVRWFKNKGVKCMLQFAYKPALVCLNDYSLKEKMEVKNYFEDLRKEFGDLIDPVLSPLII